MSTPESRTDGRILGMRKGRPETAVVQNWVPPTQAEVGEMPAVPVSPAEAWGQAHSVLQEGGVESSEGREREVAAAREKLAGAEAAFRARVQEASEVSEEQEEGEAEAESEAAATAEEGESETAEEDPAGIRDSGRADEEKVVLQAKKGAQERPETVHETISMRVQQMVRERPEDAAKLVRTMLIEDDSGPVAESAAPEAESESKAELPLLQKVAVIMVGLGEEVAGEIMKHLSDYEIEEITQAIAGLKSIPPEIIDGVLEEFEQHLLAGEWVSQGGADFARAALERAVGPRKAQEILDRVTSRVSSGFYILKNVGPEQVAPFISHEHPQTVALILSQLDANQSAGILAQLPKRMQSDVAYRIATMENITPNVIKQIEESLEASLRDMLGGNQDVGGPKVIADMLNCTGSSVEKNVLDQMDGQDPEVAEAVRNLMFTFGDIAKLTDREIQAVLEQVDQKDLVVALKGASEELKEKMLGNMSEKVRTFISEEMEFLGPMRLSEVEEVQLRIVQQVRLLEEKGQITIIRGDFDDQFI
jgi:flagellar motor switch protein FliG